MEGQFQGFDSMVSSYSELCIILDSACFIICYRFLQNGCHKRHLTHASPLNFDLTLNARVAEDVVWITTLDISNGGLHGVASTEACLQA